MTTKEHIVHLADDLIRSRGYNAFSYSDISKPLGIKNAAVHYHFPAKSDLALAVVEYHIDSIQRFEDRTSSKTPLQRVKLFLNFYSSIQLSGKICLVGAFTTDWNSLNEETRTAMSQFKAKVISWLASTLQEGKETGEIHFAETPQKEALSILTNILAAAQLARIDGSDDFQSVKESIINRITH